jgi:hypothetical protein
LPQFQRRNLEFLVNSVLPYTVFAKKNRRLLDGTRKIRPTPEEAEAQIESFAAPGMTIGRLAPRIPKVYTLDYEDAEEQIGREFDGCLGLDPTFRTSRFDYPRISGGLPVGGG